MDVRCLCGWGLGLSSLKAITRNADNFHLWQLVISTILKRMAHCSNFCSRFQDTSSTAASSVLPHDVHCNSGRITGLWEPVSWVSNVCSLYFYYFDSNPRTGENMCSYLDLQQHENWCLLIWSLLLSSCEVPPSTLDFHPLAKFGFPLIAQIIHFWEQEISAFWEHICHFVAGAPWELRWAINNDNTFPYLQFQSHCAMPCSGEAIQECDGSFCPWGEQAPVVHHLQRGEKCQLLSIPRLGSFFSRTKSCSIHG